MLHACSRLESMLQRVRTGSTRHQSAMIEQRMDATVRDKRAKIESDEIRVVAKRR